MPRLALTWGDKYHGGLLLIVVVIAHLAALKILRHAERLQLSTNMVYSSRVFQSLGRSSG